VTLIWIAFIAAVVRITVPYALAALGGTIGERAGVVQLGLEGMILTGAFAAVVGADVSHSGAVGVLFGAAAAGALALAYVLVVLVWSADQIVAGVAINLFADGLTRYLLKLRYDSESNSPRIDALAHLGGQGDLLRSLAHPLVLFTILATVLVGLMLRRTVFGLRLRAVGEHPVAARTLGIDPRRVRIAAVVLTGLLAGTGGAYLAAEQGQFVAGMSAGRGYIALAAMIFGRWRPLPAVLACVLFGVAEALQLRLQGGYFPGWAVQMLPYALTIAVLAGLGRGRTGAAAPSALGRAL
jgi:simple sugar transport system permease protein